jgi:glycerophosphoryl diester phosphodiesterase
VRATPIPRLIGHRGAAGLAPENTLAAIRAGAAAGAPMVEFDAKLTADGHVILMHDDTLERTTDGVGPVAMHTLAQIRRLDAGRWFAPAFAGERVPTMAEALALVLELAIAVNIEVKPCPGREQETAAAVIAAAKAIWPADVALPLVSSFDVAALEVALDAAPDWPRGYLIWDRPDDWAAIADRLGAATLNVCHEREDAASLAAYAATGRPVLAYTVNDVARARVLFGLGVAGVFTDRPDLLA